MHEWFPVSKWELLCMNEFYLSDIPKHAHVHFIGIGGISMSGLAEILLQKGYRVTGSDINETHITRRLASLGAVIIKGHFASNVQGANLVVYTAAIHPDNPELMACKDMAIPAIERATLLGSLMRDYGCSICVAGTHGKTTTTSMLSHVLLSAHKNPTIMLGGELDAIGGNIRAGGEKYFLTEACEYHCSFLQFFPKVAVITNVEADHLDFFKDLSHIKETFTKFASLPDSEGSVVVCGDDSNAMACCRSTGARLITYGIGSDNQLHPINLQYRSGYGEFDIIYGSQTLHVSLNVPGKHNVQNALACFAVGEAVGLSGRDIVAGLSGFTGVHRRFEKKGEVDGTVIIDDYAHHPTEIKATLSTAAKMTEGRVIVAFQPHTYSRTLLLLDEFSRAFDDADEIIVTDIYAAREKDNGKIHARDLVERLQDRGKQARYVSSFDEIVVQLSQLIRPGDIVITMGAGSIYKVGKMLLQNQIPVLNMH